MMQSDNNTALDYYSQLLPSLQHPPPLQPLTSSTLGSFSLTQQPSLQHTMSVADPFSPSWPQLFNPPSPAARKQSGAAFNGGNAGWLESAQQLLPAVSSAGLSLTGLNVQSQLSQLSQLNAAMLQRSTMSLPQQQSAVFQPMPQRALMSNSSQMVQPSPLMSPPPLQQQLSLPTTITQQQLTQLRASLQLQQQQQQQQQQQTFNNSQRMQSMTGTAPPMQPFSSPTQPSNPLSLLQAFRPTVPNMLSNSQPLLQQPTASSQAALGSTVELATALLSYLSSADLQRGLLYVNRLWRFKSLYVLQSRQVNIQVQLTHLYLGPFRASNMLELVFSLQVHQRLVNGDSDTSPSSCNGAKTTSLLRPLQLPQSVPTSPASVARTPLKSNTIPSVLKSPSTVARATVCTPMAMSAVVKAKELSKGDALLNSPSMMLSGGKQLSKKKLREAALLAESKYNSIIECGILPNADTSSASPPSHSTQRIFKLYAPFFNKQVEVYTALSDPTQQTLFRASSLAEKFDYATNKVGMYLSRRRLHSGGIYQATGFRSKPAGRTGLKCGGYFLTIEACKEFENHFQYGGLTEEQRKGKVGTESGAQAGSGSAEPLEVGGEKVDDGEMGDGEGSEDERDEARERQSAKKLKAEDRSSSALQSHRPLSAVTKKLVDTVFGHSSVSVASVGSGSRKRCASDNSDDSPNSGDMSSPSPSFKRVRSDDGGMNTTDSGSGSDSAGNMSSASVGKQSSGSDEDGSDRSPGPSSRITHFHTHSHNSSHTASTSSSSSVGSSSSFHRSAFKAPTPMRSSSFQASPSSTASVGSVGSNLNNESTSPPLSVRDISPSSSPGSQTVPTLPASASFLPSISSSSPSPSFSSSAFPSLTRWHSFASPLMSPTGTQSMFSQPSATNYVQLSSPPLGVSHKFNGLSLAGAAGNQSSSTSMPAPVVPLSISSGQSLEAAFAAALMQSGQAGGMALTGPTASVGANGLLNLNNLTLQQLQQLLSGQLSNSHPSAQPLNALSQQPSLLNFVLMSAAGQAASSVQTSQQQQQQTVQPVQFG